MEFHLELIDLVKVLLKKIYEHLSLSVEKIVIAIQDKHL